MSRATLHRRISDLEAKQWLTHPPQPVPTALERHRPTRTVNTCHCPISRVRNNALQPAGTTVTPLEMNGYTCKSNFKNKYPAKSKSASS